MCVPLHFEKYDEYKMQEDLEEGVNKITLLLQPCMIQQKVKL